MNTLHKTTQPAYDKYGNKVEAKTTVQAESVVHAAWELDPRDLDRAGKAATIEALTALTSMERALGKIERAGGLVESGGEFGQIFQTAATKFVRGGFRNSKIIWMKELQLLKQRLLAESGQ